MRFADPTWLFAGLIVLAALFAAYLKFDARQRAALAQFASNHLLDRLTGSFSRSRRRLKRLLFSGAIAFIFVALARPQIGYHWEEEKQRGIDILFAIDTSKSMLTQDVTPDRLTRAKLAIIDFVNKLGTDRVGLIAFAGDAFLQAPLTLDYDAFKESLDAIDTNVIPRGGTDIAAAIKEGVAAFGADTKNKKILVLITDGEDLESKGVDAAKVAADQGLTIYTVGVGSPAGGLIPVPGANGGTDFMKDDTGQFVKSHLDEATLRQIASVTGGVYEPLGQRGEGLDKLYSEALATLPKQDVSSRREKVYDDRFQWPLALGVGLLVASLLVGTRRRDVKVDVQPVRSRVDLRTKRPVRRAVTAGAAVLVLAMLAPAAQASPQAAERAYKQGNYDDAEDEYSDAVQAHPNVAPLQFNMGAAAYKAGDFDKALPAFQKALGSDQIELQQQAYYNLGNTQFRVGEKTEASAPDDTVKRWQEAVQAYDAALKLKADDADAKYNREFVQKKLEHLQKQQEKKKDQNKQNEKPDEDQGQKQNPNSQQQNQPNQNQQQNSGSQANNQQNQGQQGQNTQSPNQGQQNGSQQASNSGQQGGQNQANGQQPDKSQGAQGQQQSQNMAQNQQGQNGKPDQQQGNQANGQNPQQSSAQNQAQNGNQQNPNGQPDKQQGQQQTAGAQGNPSQDKGPQGQQNGEGQNPQVAQNGSPGGGHGTPGKDGQQAAGGSEPSTPGVLSREEARELLDSLKNGEHALPVTADVRTGNRPQNQPVLKDW